MKTSWRKEDLISRTNFVSYLAYKLQCTDRWTLQRYNTVPFYYCTEPWSFIKFFCRTYFIALWAGRSGVYILKNTFRLIKIFIYRILCGLDKCSTHKEFSQGQACRRIATSKNTHLIHINKGWWLIFCGKGLLWQRVKEEDVQQQAWNINEMI